ncbi:serine kinase of the HPr protein, regulates carbohydrate metabolism [Terriglobus roseus DSM 18391]|uniref:Serine kinase of the HPr protein, regulates carbohydrate metabolism n=1 Tax=Terriglobus roseus (strain DSM 18391 / NRRL B-41598 / KBS 63) TaxID=926566 RepID=I3ZE30_TERRK|nr:aldolase [Terriglobus roseus]AFL87498.1 serine kinase of the HPr protein, regulates carbohydrate metabolism [Terriglobus roseus DSM 18391]
MTIQEIEAFCTAEHKFDFRRHPLESPQLTMSGCFYPLGFPVNLRTNASEVLQLYAASWDSFRPRYDATPINIDVHVIEEDAAECPPAPHFRMLLPLMTSIADERNYSIFDLARAETKIVLSRAALRHPLYASYFFLESAAACHIVTRYAPPIHAGCVEWNGRGLLLCGDSGAGKSTLSYACARAGFGYVTDDAAYLLYSGNDQIVTGNSQKVRLRPESAEFFPEIRDLPMTPRAAGKPSVEIETSEGIVALEETQVAAIIFLNRRTGQQALLPYRREVAREFMRQLLFGTTEQLAWQYSTVERLLDAPVLELHYTDLEWATQRLKQYAQDGR